MKTLTALKKLKKLQKALDKADGWEERQILLRQNSNDIVRGLDADALIELIDAAKELSEILNDIDAKENIDSFTVQPIDLALLKLKQDK